MKIKKLGNILAILCAFTLLSGCTNSEAPESSDTTSSSTSSADSGNSSSSSSSTENSFEESSNECSDEPKPVDYFTAPDGSTVYFSDAVGYDGMGYMYDFVCIRYSKPIFYNTIDESDLVNWNSLEFKTNYVMPIENPGTFKIKAGDKLENGLAVIAAESQGDESGILYRYDIEFSGELTFDGILYRAPEDGYGVNTDDLRFFPDPTKYSFIPDAPFLNSESTFEWVDTDAEFAMVGDITQYQIGNFNDVSVDLSGIVKRGEFVKAKITIKDICLKYNNFGGGVIYSATLVSVEKANS